MSGKPSKDSAREKGPSDAHPLWGGRFSARPSDVMARINASIDVDRRLYDQDIAGSRTQCRMLAAQGIIAESDRDAILAGLERIEGEIARGEMAFDPALEDIHMHIEARLHTLIGAPAGRLHTARSRNDQVATDFRLWVREAVDGLDGALRRFQEVLLDRAEEHAATLMPGFTHLQTAQPVTFGHHLMAYVEMARRDRGRLKDCRARLDECPLGSCALAGTSFPVDREATARELGFRAPMRNSLDAVSDRDFALEYLGAVAIAAMHLSRLAEEIVIWTSPPFGFVRLSDAFATGSSIMPQKRNPDAAELVRAKTGRVYGAQAALLTVMKGLPLAYAKDMQEDKAPVFEATDAYALSLAAMTGMIGDLEVDAGRMASAAGAGYATATDLADWLVRELGMPFREAHRVTGAVVKCADALGLPLHELPLEEMQAVDARIGDGVYSVLSPEASVASRTSFGGTAPERVREAIARARKEMR